MRDYIYERAIDTGNYVIETKSTIRETANFFKVSKTTIHKDLTQRLPEVNGEIAKEVNAILQQNKAERHIRGGRATKLKFKN